MTSLFDATSHEHQLSRIDREGDALEATLKSGEYGIEFSDAPNSWTFSRSIQNAMATLAEQFGEQMLFMGEEAKLVFKYATTLFIELEHEYDL